MAYAYGTWVASKLAAMLSIEARVSATKNNKSEHTHMHINRRRETKLWYSASLAMVVLSPPGMIREVIF